MADSEPLVTSAWHNRYNWHPLVHERFGETLYYYLVRVRDASLRAVSEQIRDALQRADIHFACEYTVFGYWDGLVRVWLTQAARHRLGQVLRQEASNVAEAREFQTSQIRYLWTGNDQDLVVADGDVLASIAERGGDIRAAARSPIIDSEQEQRLVTAGLLLRRPSSSGTAVKFYISLAHVGGEPRREDEVQRLVDAVKSAGLADRASVYAGLGTFADYLVRCVADTYGDVLGYTASLDPHLLALRVRPMTLLIANPAARESDNINDLAALSTRDEHTVSLLELGDEGNLLLKGLAEPQRQALNDLVDRAHELSAGDPRLRAKVRALLRASLEDDRDAVTAAAAFLLEFEWLLIEYLKRAWARVFGPKAWRDRVAEEFTRTGHNQEADAVSKPDTWTLGTCVHMATTSAEINKEVNAYLTAHLGGQWKSQMRSLLKARNMLAHGQLRTLAHFDDFTGEWGNTLRDLLNVATLHFKFERLMEKGVELSA